MGNILTGQWKLGAIKGGSQHFCVSLSSGRQCGSNEQKGKGNWLEEKATRGGWFMHDEIGGTPSYASIGG
jgi:hypothetical protein